MRIDLLGAEFNIKTDQDPEYLEEVVEFYRSKVQEVRASVGTADPLRIAILAGILTADEHLKLTGSQRTNTAELSQITLDLITTLDQALAPPEAPGGEPPETPDGSGTQPG